MNKLEIGAGNNTKTGWISTDIIPSKGVMKLDVTQKFPFQDNTFKFVYSEHMIEHLTLQEGQFMLKECFRILQQNGTIRIVTPSLKFLFRICSPTRNDFEQEYFEWSIKKFVPETTDNRFNGSIF